MRAEDVLVLDHLSIQCADTAGSAAFYDDVLTPLGGSRVMEFGQVIGFGIKQCRGGLSHTGVVLSGRVIA